MWWQRRHLSSTARSSRVSAMRIDGESGLIPETSLLYSSLSVNLIGYGCSSESRTPAKNCRSKS